MMAIATQRARRIRIRRRNYCLPINWTLVLLALIGGLPGTIAAIVAGFIALHAAGLTSALTVQQTVIAGQMDQVKRATDGMKDMLVAATRENGINEGKVIG